MKNKKQLKITPVRGRPMLYWAGKTPPETVRYFPAQLCERMGADAPEEPDYASFMGGYNMLLHGDNREVLSSLLVGGFRHKIDLIYIDPPFDSGADYVRKVQLRGLSEKLSGEEQSFLEQTQYEDIWLNDHYLQFMYERLVLMRELLSERGSIYLHCDWHKNYYLRLLMDEVFGEDNFRNEILTRRAQTKNLQNQFDLISKMNVYNDTIYWYSKSVNARFSPPMKDATESQKVESWQSMWNNADRPTMRYELLGATISSGQWKWKKERAEKAVNNYLTYKKDHASKMSLLEYWRKTGMSLEFIRQKARGKPEYWIPPREKVLADNNWFDIKAYSYSNNYETEKSEALLERIIKASSSEDSIVLDCFCGSGTTAAVAQKLGRRWIAADMNRGAVQTTAKRIGKILSGKNGGNLAGKPRGFAHYRVNNYDFSEEKAAREIIIRKLGLTSSRDGFFPHLYGESLAYIAPLNKPLTRRDVQLIDDELRNNRPRETRGVVLIGNGSETGLAEETAKAQKRRAINKIEIIDVQMDGLIARIPAAAVVQIRKNGKTAAVKIADYVSPSIMARLNMPEGAFRKKITDFRAQIDRVLWDSDYDGKCFNICGGDCPEKKTDLIAGEYKIALPRPGATVAVKIVDMLGEETIVVK